MSWLTCDEVLDVYEKVQDLRDRTHMAALNEDLGRAAAALAEAAGFLALLERRRARNDKEPT